ncbi:MAG: RNA pseudouridine synthase [Firmicutes bacterium]|nr:RNA pseudouridine synthase [Bacillota bacterium]
MDDLNILYEDKNIIALAKKEGVPSQPDKSGDRSLLEDVQAYTGGVCHIITRLDRPVSGIVLFAKDEKNAARYTASLEKAEKIYYAVCEKCKETPKSGEIESYILKDGRKNISKIVNKGSVGGKKALLSYEILTEKDGFALCRINLKTGRHHQIRVQMASIGMPLYGDTKYNENFKHKRGVYPLLHAARLIIEGVNIYCPPAKERLLFDEFYTAVFN